MYKIRECRINIYKQTAKRKKKKKVIKDRKNKI